MDYGDGLDKGGAVNVAALAVALVAALVVACLQGLALRQRCLL
jgi:hypothetical protein